MLPARTCILVIDINATASRIFIIGCDAAAVTIHVDVCLKEDAAVARCFDVVIDTRIKFRISLKIGGGIVFSESGGITHSSIEAAHQNIEVEYRVIGHKKRSTSGARNRQYGGIVRTVNTMIVRVINIGHENRQYGGIVRTINTFIVRVINVGHKNSQTLGARN